MRWFLVFGLMTSSVFAAAPALLGSAVQAFRADPPPGWSFTQTTTAQGESLVERCDAAQPEFARWTLLQKDGRTPTAQEKSEYAEMRSRRSRGGTAPKITDQLDLERAEPAGETAERSTYRCPLKPAEKGDATAPFLRATIVVHKPSQTIESIELANVAPFSPTLAVRIAEMKTTMSYAPPAGDAPTLPQKVTTHVRGRAFWVKSLDADMVVTFTNYERARKK